MRRVEADNSFKNIDALEAQLKDIPSVRPEKVEEAKASMASLQYPPEQVLNSIAALLAMEIK